MKTVVLVLTIIFIGSPVIAQPGLAVANKYPFDMMILNSLSDPTVRNDTLTPVGSNHKFCYLNIYTKRKLANLEFDEAYPFVNKFALIKQNGRYGIIDRTGRFIIQPAHDKVELNKNKHYGDGDLGIVFDGQQAYFSFYTGIIVPGKCDVGGYPTRPQLHPYKKANKYGIMFDGPNYPKKIRQSKPIYDSVLSWSGSYLILKKLKFIGVIDNFNRPFLKFEYTDFAGTMGIADGYLSSNEMYALKRKNTWCYYDGFNKLFESNFKPVELNFNVIIFQNKDGLYNYMDNSGKVMLPKNYKWISSSGYVVISEKDEVMLLNNKNEEFIYYKN